MDFDETRLYYSHQQLQVHPSSSDAPGATAGGAVEEDWDEYAVDLLAARRHFREFLRKLKCNRVARRDYLSLNLCVFGRTAGVYRLGSRYIYRERLLRMHRRIDQAENTAKTANIAKIEVDLAHLGEYDAALLGHIRSQPAQLLPALESAASDALQTLLYDQRRQNNNNNTMDETQDEEALNNNNDTNKSTPLSIQVLLKGNLTLTPLRSMKSEHMHGLLKCPGIVISTSPVKNRAVCVKIRCSRCNDERTIFNTEGAFGSIALPAYCRADRDRQGVGENNENNNCPRYPYTVVPDESQFVDQQVLKLQEAPERVPTGEMPRSVLLAVERSLVDVAPPGTRVSVICIPTLFTSAAKSKRDSGTKSVYLRVVGLSKDNDAHGQSATFTPAEEEAFQALAKTNVYDILNRSIAPNISGSYTVDIKKALTCQLFGGSRKRLPDGVRLRGDINVLLLGDPSMAKSQFLKFISRVAPVGIYTSGKGSSAAGLTASVVRDSKGEFYLEGGAMVLADGGIVCVDEFDKMRPTDRVAIHEAMEQQTISIAKAGITTVLNARSSVLAAANPVFGRYDDLRSASENIDLMTTILSRFDLIFLVRDIREEDRDRMICQHVMGVHISSSRNSDGGLGHAMATSDNGDSGMLSYMAATAMPGQDDAANNNGYVEHSAVTRALHGSPSHLLELPVETRLQKPSLRTSCR